jgi:aminoglycoside phosphotransferase (APT) family kinase protein
MQEILDWCASILGPFEVVSDDTRDHPGKRVAACRLRARSGDYYVKLHRDPVHWNYETHGYEQWAPAFGKFAPRLLAVREEAPLALLISELPGKILDEVKLTAAQERAVWQTAGQALVALHGLAVGDYFGPCRRDGAPVGTPINEATAYVMAEFEDWLERGRRIACLTDDELAIVSATRELIPVFAGERPVPCHRDYGPANWLITAEGAWAGVIDFEFAYWEVRVADFTRYPNWEWLNRPDLIEAFFEGYGRAFTPEEEQQRLVGHTLYALGALVWGQESAYYGFAAEGRQALQRLGELLR